MINNDKKKAETTKENLLKTYFFNIFLNSSPDVD